LPDRALAALVQSACNKPGSRQITHDHVRSGHGAWMACPCRIPKLTVRVRFPSPAPDAKNVAIHTNWAPFPVWIGACRHQDSALVPLPRAITQAGGTVSSSVLVAGHADLRLGSKGSTRTRNCWTRVQLRGSFLISPPPASDSNCRHHLEGKGLLRTSIPGDRFFPTLESAVGGLAGADQASHNAHKPRGSMDA